MNVFRARVELLLAVCSMLSPLSKCVNVSGDNETRNRFIPAPPGQRPACAKPGLTYCEYVSNYPTDTIISVLTELSGESFNVSSVFFDESDGFQEPSELLSGHFRKSRKKDQSKLVVRFLVSLDPIGRLVLDRFFIPSCCSYLS
ncbi:uncharacterized protein LOC143256213 isoform X3 [Tachypleus tridentatus]|uniref:uncharacterized protein LOC143256213 isoform X3 n=1 Tax=Tachypleus tridentatus TaxID=6853 RepID=UPI003FD54D86